MLKPDSSIQVENVSLNTARIGFTRTLERMGADISVRHTGAAGKEPYGIVSACYTPNLNGCEVPADKIATIVDEVPVLALVAAHARGVTVSVSYTHLVFGRESRGLPLGLIEAHANCCVRIPMREGLRSLNLSNAVAVAAYEALRQQGWPGLG